jgi:alpha-mannosidase
MRSMTRQRTWSVVVALLLAAPAARLFTLQAAPPRVLWEIGRSDGSNAEFALAPGDYRKFGEDGLFVVGRSDARTSWPYVQPGPADGWAGRRSHEFTVVFGVKGKPGSDADDAGCRVVVELLDAHPSAPPLLRGRLNDVVTVERQLPAGGGDASIGGNLAKGKSASWAAPFPCSALRAGNNTLTLTTVSGSWLLYDNLRLEAPAAVETAPVADETHITNVRVPPVWLKSGTDAVQPVSVRLRHVGADADVTLRAGGAEATAVRVQQGYRVVDVKVAATEQEREIPVTLAAGGQAETVTVKVVPPGVRELWLLPHSHVDIGYTHRQDEVIGIQVGNLVKAMELARASAGAGPGQQFKWNPEAVWTLDHFQQRATAEQREAFVKAVAAGEVGVDGLFANMLTGLCRPEELLQAVAPATKLAALTGVPVASASTCDVPGWTWGLVAMLAQAGVKYFAIGPNFGDRVGTIHVWDDKPFYWKSPSGAERVLCWVVDNYHHHGGLEPEVIGYLDRLRTSGFAFETSFMFWVGAWPNGAVDNAPPDEQLAEKAASWNAKYAAPRVVIGLTGEFFKAFEAKHGASLREFSGDLTPYWEDGAASTSRETGMNRASADRLSQAATLLAMRGPDPVPAPYFEAAWKNVLLYSEHTWGADRSISQPDDPFTLDQWKVKQGFAIDADRQSRELLAGALPASRGAISSVDVYNTTQWERSDVAVVPAEVGAAGVADEGGKPLPSQRLSSGEILFVARSVPPFGARRYRLLWRPPVAPAGGAKVSDDGTRLETGTLRVGIDAATGAVTSLRVQDVAVDLVDSKAGVGLNDFRYVLGEDAAGAATNGPVKISIVEKGPVVVAVRIESDAPGCNRLVRDVRLVDGVDRVQLVDTVDRKAVREKDGVHFGFGFNVPGGTVRMETPWAVVRPNEDQLPGSNRNWFTVQRWVDVSNAQLGITLAPLDAPLVEVGGITANLLGSVAYDRWMTQALSSQTLFSWAQNNHWHTNYKADQPGETVFRYVLRPHAGGFSAADAARFGMETSRPLVAVASDAKSTLPEPLLTVSSPDVLVETVKASEDGRGVVVRLFGVGGKREAVTVKWNGWKPRAVWRTDLAERQLEKVAGVVEVPAYGVVHLLATR